MADKKNPKDKDPKGNVPSGKEPATPVTGTRKTRSGTATALPESKATSPETLLDPSEGLDPLEGIDPGEDLIDYNDVTDDDEAVLDGATSSAKQIAAKAEAVTKVAQLAQAKPADSVSDTSKTLIVEGLRPLQTTGQLSYRECSRLE